MKLSSLLPYHRGVSLLFLSFFLLFLVHGCDGWSKWDYSTLWSEDATDVQIAGILNNWYNTWGTRQVNDSATQPPRARMGHTLVKAVIMDPDPTVPDEIYVVMFGGRDNDNNTEHIPRTYDVEIVDGRIAFTTYDQKPVSPCNDAEEQIYWTLTEEEKQACLDDPIDKINVGVIYNDVWAYKITGPRHGLSGKNIDRDRIEPGCDRYDDDACEDSGWVLWHPGAREGGCLIQLGIEVCNVPSERYHHGAAMFVDGCMYVYGGFSQRCQDYCDDIWFFDIYMKNWRQVYGAGELSQYYTIITTTVPPTIQPYPNVSISEGDDPGPWAGPGRRWKFSMETDGQKMMIFGGHRLWHGYSIENSVSNDWGANNTRQPGGYLNDLWVYHKELDFITLNGSGFHSEGENSYWEELTPKEVCANSWDGVAWDNRAAETCRITWPSARAGHGSVIDSKRNILWIYGGYSTYFPYVNTGGSGAGAGVQSDSRDGFVPYPEPYISIDVNTYQGSTSFYKNDLWYYNISSGLWTEVEFEPDDAMPGGRSDMIFVMLNDEILMHGGTGDNYVFDDFWYFNITIMKWFEKKSFVHPRYPPSCTDDQIRETPDGYEYIGTDNCTKLSWPKHLERQNFYPFNVLPYADQEMYWPDADRGPYYDIREKGFSDTYLTDMTTGEKLAELNNRAADGTPIVPRAATGPMQYVKMFTFEADANTKATMHERCTSVEAEPTRGLLLPNGTARPLDGLDGRSSERIRIPIPRTQAPGWDGCRNGPEGSTDQIQGLRYDKPTGRWGHSGIFVSELDEFYVFGGMAYDQERYPVIDNTWTTSVSDEFWYINFTRCIKNCSNHGDCVMGFCFCDVGYWGEDCSNSSCPGTSCYYDELTHEQNCVHACQAGYNHTDADVYVQDIAKLPCTREQPGISNGICDGYGTSMCAPPFVGEDCSIKDCKDHCNYNGWCSLEYPVARCVCNPGFYGDVCQYMQCLNNCSHPNGVCNSTSGFCNCRMMYSPYNNTREYYPWAGEDCSYLMPYAAASGTHTVGTFLVLAWVSMCVFLLVDDVEGIDSYFFYSL